MLRFLDAGESHGKALMAIIDGVPSNAEIDIDFINNELIRRQNGYGRGKRMQIEKDRVEIWSGIRGTKTTGNPITMVIFNKDYENWAKVLNGNTGENEKITIPRPGHGDMVGYFKYKTGDIRDVIERTSARETAIRTAVGALCKCILVSIGVDIRSKVMNIGGIEDDNVDLFDNEAYLRIENSSVRCYNEHVENMIKYEIDKCKQQGDTVGGSIFISVRGVPLGIGSYIQWDRKLDAILSYALMSVQGIKAIEFGKGTDLAKRGTTFNDEILCNKGEIIRPTNNCGGIEAGVSNGQNIEITVYMKPIPTIKKSIRSVDLKNNDNVVNRYERSDVCGVVPASIVLENVCAFEILKEILNTYPADDIITLKKYIEK
ncbi:chorismate synthase [Clostridium tepidiprofundi DSM 19306]|uniref:Chorismate synthase n=1 Tax=Clostridium tepidiprofundi DSM 19306 TaxID=1121338 RepID=A0A151B275_9CLOT|nr:chorismate synthase [Clostridium tepidiprofundi]KYH34015.1 chorismate synthase [Clostridium tepidiprofundi DSM 19306]